MRGLEVGIYLLCVVMSLALIPVLVPGYNGNAGLDTGGADVTGMSAFNWSEIEPPAETSNNIIIAIAQQAEYYFNLALAALWWIANLGFSLLWSAPALITIFGINVTLAAILLTALGIILLLTWFQIAKGDDWSGRR